MRRLFRSYPRTLSMLVVVIIGGLVYLRGSCGIWSPWQRPKHFSYQGYTYAYLPENPDLPGFKAATENNHVMKTIGHILGHPLLEWPHLGSYRPNGPPDEFLAIKGWGGYAEYMYVGR